jgi:heat shock protein HtpX
MYSEIDANKRKTWIILGFFIGLVAALSFIASEYIFGQPSFTAVVVVIAAIYALITYLNATKMATAIHGAKEVDGQTAPRLYRIVENLAITQGMPMPKVYIIDDPGMNAFATGRDPDHAIVAATSGIIDALDDAELEGVMAHELGHVKNYDIRVSMVAFALVSVIAIISDIMLRSFIWGNRRDREGGNAVVIIVALAVAILAPISAKLLQLAISRKREYLADATGALTTRYPEGLARALEKISTHGSSLKKQSTATAHLFFANPLKKTKMTRWFSTHPPVQDRIAKLRDMGGKL